MPQEPALWLPRVESDALDCPLMQGAQELGETWRTVGRCTGGVLAVYQRVAMVYLGEPFMRMSFSKAEGRSREAMHPIMADMEWPTYTQRDTPRASRMASTSRA